MGRNDQGPRVSAVFSAAPPVTVPVSNGPFLAADVGGTHVRVGLVQASGDASHPVRVLVYRKYACAEFAGLGDILEHFVNTLDVAVEAGAIASAGHRREDGTLLTVNLPWPVSLDDIRRRLGFRDFSLVNDFEAVAHAAVYVDGSEVLQLSGPADAPAGPTLILGPGTGLGAAVWMPTAHGPVVLATEAGQAALTVGTSLELSLLTLMLRERSHVSMEHALSGPGLMYLHATLCTLHGIENRHESPGSITAAAMSGSDAAAHESLSVFCGLLGSSVGNMALLYGACGGIYLAGGILPHIREFLLQSSFVERFLDKGPMREALERIPVKLVEHGQLGVLGAANWYLGRNAASRAQGDIDTRRSRG